MARQATLVSVVELNPNKWGSLEEQTLSLSRALRDRGWRSFLFFSQAASGQILSEFRDSGATVKVLPRRGTSISYARLASTLLEIRPTVVHFNLCNSFSPLPIVAKLSGAKAVFFTEQVCRPRDVALRTKVKCYLWDRIILRGLAIRVVTPSEHVRQVLTQTYMVSPGRVHVLRQGVNVKRFEPADAATSAAVRCELSIPVSDRVVACAAHLIPEKGVGDLLSAAKQVLKVMPDVTVAIAGDGRLAGGLRQAAQDLGIVQKVRFLGLRSDVHRLFATADVVVVPSVWEEPGALVLAEAMASGRPVVATRAGGNAEYVEDGTDGIVVDRQAPNQIARALLSLLGSPSVAKAMGLAGRSAAETRFSMERWVRDTLAMYDAALGQG